MTEPNAILAISSLDRLTNNQTRIIEQPPNSGNLVPQRIAVPLDTALYSQYRAGLRGGINPDDPGAANFTLEYPTALIYGYFKSITVSQIQVDYNIPTVNPLNSRIPMRFIRGGIAYFRVIEMPIGFYTPEELAAILTILIQQEGDNGVAFFPNFTVTYDGGGGGSPGFTFDAGVPQFTDTNWYWEPFAPDVLGNPPTEIPPENAGGQPIPLPPFLLGAFLRAYKLFGIKSRQKRAITLNVRAYSVSPQFLPTYYLDICSSALTKYQKVKDAETSPDRRSDIIARVYLTGIGSPQYTVGQTGLGVVGDTTDALGCRPFIVTVDLNNSKVIRWDKEEALYNMDFQVYDMYGDLMYWSADFPTEFQLTLQCSEGN
jgi:hypothetical protein